MISKGFVPFKRIDNWFGINSKDAQENILDGEWDERSRNVVSDKRGGIGMRRGYTSLTTASIGSTTAWCGFYDFRKSTAVDFYLGAGSDGKIYSFETNQYVELGSGMATGQDARFSFLTLDDMAIILDGQSSPQAYPGSGSIATLSGTLVTADFGLSWQKYAWLHSSVDKRVVFYNTTIGDPESGFTSFLNFDDDEYEVTALAKQGDDMIVGKQKALHRVQYTGSVPFVNKYRLPSKVGPINHWVFKSTGSGSERLIFLSSDYQVYMLIGDNVIEIGDNAKKLFKEGNNSRLRYAVAGILESKNQYWISFTHGASATKNDMTLVCDYSRPYQDKFGKIQYPWFIYDIVSNCFAEVIVSGVSQLWHGGYTGKMYRDDVGTNDDGASIVNNYISKHMSHDDPTIEKKYGKQEIAYESKGDYNLNIAYTVDKNSNSRKTKTQNMLGGQGVQTLWGVGIWNVDYWADADDGDVYRDIDLTGKLIQVEMGTSALDADWYVSHYSIMAKALRRGVNRTREAA